MRISHFLRVLVIGVAACTPRATTTTAPPTARLSAAPPSLLPALRVAADSFLALSGLQGSSSVWPDRHAATPGQLATYYIGYEAIRSYRERAEATLGARFRSPELHREVLKDGTVTLASLGAKVDRWIATTSARTAQTPAPTKAAALDSVPFELEDARIYVPVSDSSGLLGWFILDTGAGPSGVDVGIAARWRARAIDSSLSTGAGAGRTRSSTIPGRPLRVGRIPFRTETLNVLPLDSLLGAVSGRVVSGIIGSAFFYQHAVTIDFDTRQLYLGPAGTLGTVPGATEVAFTLQSDVPHVAGTLRLPDGRTLDANYLVDIGAKATVLFAEPFLERHHVGEALTGASFTAPLGAGVGGRTRYRFTRVPEVAIGADGGARWNDLVVGLSVGGTLGASYYDGLFGLDMLTRYTPTFDYATRRLVLAPRANPPASSEIDLSGLFLTEERSPRAVRVSTVLEPSPAKDASIAVGDEVVAVDGKPASSLTLAQIRDVLRSRPGRRVELRLRHGDRVVARTITLRRMA